MEKQHTATKAEMEKQQNATKIEMLETKVCVRGSPPFLFRTGRPRSAFSVQMLRPCFVWKYCNFWAMCSCTHANVWLPTLLFIAGNYPGYRTHLEDGVVRLESENVSPCPQVEMQKQHDATKSELLETKVCVFLFLGKTGLQL